MTQDVPAGLHIAAILGSVRPADFAAKALALAAGELRKRGIAPGAVDPARLALPPPGIAPDTSDAQALREPVARATGVILATPEYHGSFGGVMKLVIEKLGFPPVPAGTPAALLGVAAGQIGAIKSLEARASVCTHVGAIVLPGAVSAAGVRRLSDGEGRWLDAGVEKRIRSAAAQPDRLHPWQHLSAHGSGRNRTRYGKSCVGASFDSMAAGRANTSAGIRPRHGFLPDRSPLFPQSGGGRAGGPPGRREPPGAAARTGSVTAGRPCPGADNADRRGDIALSFSPQDARGSTPQIRSSEGDNWTRNQSGTRKVEGSKGS
jgi:chromate reductase